MKVKMPDEWPKEVAKQIEEGPINFSYGDDNWEVTRPEPEIEGGPRCPTCGRGAVESEVCAWMTRGKYEGFPAGPQGDPEPVAVEYRCWAGHSWAENIRRPK